MIVICTNTIHKVIPYMDKTLTIPIIHTADPTARKLQNEGIQRVGLLGTQYTMEQDFYTSRLEANGITVSIPNREDRQRLNAIILKNCASGKPASLQKFCFGHYKTVIQSRS
ncbi:hypothetical protein GCM10008986_26110 [Salinibacillus aidingensis]|uniref:Aspartate racemase n=1 Tax=Salinibacillus aidingensis TaxID=237684 RepID=A0ABN1BJ53_9BACI